MEECLRVLFYRDCRALNRIRIAKATAEGTVISEFRISFFFSFYLPAVILIGAKGDAYPLTTTWAAASFQAVKGGLEGDGGW